ncbi:MAG: hypothetical protein V2A73_16680 [Pseudomonadota bacterium]
MTRRLLGGGEEYAIYTCQAGELTRAQLLQISRECTAHHRANREAQVFRVGWSAAGWWDATDPDAYYQAWGMQEWAFGSPAT